MYRRRPWITATPALSLLCGLTAFSSSAQLVEVTTPEGVITMRLRSQDAPLTAANLLRYISDNDYEDSFFHRSVPGFVIQAGGFTIDENSQFFSVPTDPPVPNEPGVSNTRGTVAMAKLGGDPDSATSQWFINLADNNDPNDPLSLDNQNGGFTVFADVVEGMAVADAIAALPRVDIGGAFTQLPLLLSAQPPIVDQNEVVLTSYRVIADMTGDLDVDDEDLGIIFSNFTGPTGSGRTTGEGDLDGDGDVDDRDLGIAFSSFTGPQGPSAAVPEPGSAVLLGIGALALARRRRR